MARQTAAQKAAAAAALQAPAVTRTKTGKTVTVACKIPTGLRLQLCVKVEKTEQTMAGSKKVEAWEKRGQVVVVQGPAAPVGGAPRGYRPPVIAGGYALTRNIDAEFFTKWMEQNAQNPIVKNRLIFAQDTTASVASEAREFEEVRSGLEPLDPENQDPRMPKSMSAGVDNIKTADEMAGRKHFATFVDEAEDAEV